MLPLSLKEFPVISLGLTIIHVQNALPYQGKIYQIFNKILHTKKIIQYLQFSFITNKTWSTLGPRKDLKLLCIFYSSVTHKVFAVAESTKCAQKKIHALSDFCRLFNHTSKISFGYFIQYLIFSHNLLCIANKRFYVGNLNLKMKVFKVFKAVKRISWSTFLHFLPI